jgi:uncharacterized repeat protein (TIGR01451 family)
MKSFKLFLLSLMLNFGFFVAPAAAQQIELDFNFCTFSSQSQVPCDLSIQKEVSVNGGAFFDANTPGDAVNAQVGDTITWLITVTNNLPSTAPVGDIAVTDAIPAGVQYVSDSATTGSYDETTDLWEISVGTFDEVNYNSNLPAQLEIVTTAASVGLVENRADLSASCGGDCEYEDGDTSNNFDLAYVNIQSKPQVLGDSTTSTPQVLALVDTGSGQVAAQIAIGVSIIALAWVARRANDN